MTVAAVAEVERSQGDEEMKDLGPGGGGDNASQKHQKQCVFSVWFVF